MQNSPTILQGTDAPTTSYFPPEDSKEETRGERFQRQTEEAKARAADLQKRYNYLMIKTGSSHDIGSKRNLIQVRAAVEGFKAKDADVALKSTIVKPSVRTGGIPVPTGRPGLPASLPAVPTEAIASASATFQPDGVQPMATSYFQGKKEGGDSRDNRHRQRQNDAFDKAAELKREYTKMKPATSHIGSKRNVIQERATRSQGPSQDVKTSKDGINIPNTSLSKDPSFPTNSKVRSPSPELPRAPPDTWQAQLPGHQMDEADLACLKMEGFPLGESYANLSSHISACALQLIHSVALTNSRLQQA